MPPLLWKRNTNLQAPSSTPTPQPTGERGANQPAPPRAQGLPRRHSTEGTRPLIPLARRHRPTAGPGAPTPSPFSTHILEKV
eukprot:4691529-Amphidinium_carterae.1